MKKLLLLLYLAAFFQMNAQDVSKPDLAPVKVVIDNYHGQELEDPYRYMEDLKNEEVVNWMKANANYAKSVLNSIPGKKEIFDTTMELLNRRESTVNTLAITKSNDYYYLKRTPGEEIGKMYKRHGFEGEESLFFDPETYKKDSGQTYAIQSISPNLQGDKIAVSLSPNGSENPEVLIFKPNGERLSETVHLAIGLSWLKSGNAFYYAKFNSADVTDMSRKIFMKVHKHEIGTDPKSDPVVFSKELSLGADVEDIEIPIVLYVEEVDMDVLYLYTVDNNLKSYFKKSGADSNTPWQVLTSRNDNITDIEVNNDHVFFLSSNGAANFKIMSSSVTNPSLKNAKTLVPESSTEIITAMTANKDGLYYTTMENGVKANVYFLKNESNTPKKLKLPFAAGEAYIDKKNSESSDIWIGISGWTSPSKRYFYNPEDDTFKHQQLSTTVEYPELENLIAKEVMVKSHDGVMVPVSIIHKKNITLNGQNPTAIYGYGSYGVSMTPFFSPVSLAYTLYDGIMVVPHVRGGGELGESWHNAGKKETKSNTWKDAIATAEYLIKEGYTSPGKLSIYGGSAGGIFVGRAITERPDLFSAGAPIVGSMNTVRGEETPNGPVNAPEFGTVKDPNEFKWLLEMDSYHHVKDNEDYPAMIITAGFNDPRVIAWQPAKFAARMQAATGSDNPVLFYTNFEGGHGGGTKLTDTIDELSGIFAFFYWQAGHPKFQPNK